MAPKTELKLLMLVSCTIIVVVSIVFDVLRGTTFIVRELWLAPLVILGGYIIMLVIDALATYMEKNKE